MLNRIEKKFKDLQRRKKKAFIAFITCGEPDLKTTKDLVIQFERAGVDIVELGVPFSDPLADGVTIQESSQRALKKGVTLKKIFQTVSSIRKFSQIPIALMSYYNPIFHFGEKEFIIQAKRLGVDGLIIPDLPPEEAEILLREAKAKHLSTIFFLSPTTTKSRLKKIVQASTGFIYYVSLTGVTGIRKNLSDDIIPNVRLAKRYTPKPICVGFGISNPNQIKSVSSIADGVIVGSAIIKEIVKNDRKKDLVNNVVGYVQRLTKVLS